MKTHANKLCLALCLAVSSAAVEVQLTGCAGDRYTRSPGEYFDDTSLQLRASTALGDNSDYKFEAVSVAVFKGVVQLGGFVDRYNQKIKAGEIISRVPGIKDVYNNITVRGQSPRSPGESNEDDSLLASVKTKLSVNPDYQYAEVNVATFRGTVQLSGFVNTSDQKARAGDLVRAVAGVKDVFNNITVKEKI